MNRHSANRSPAAQRRSRPLEVLVAQVHAWMEESNEFSRVWISSRDVRTFVPITVKTGEGEILKMIDVKRQRISVSGKVTILASALGTLPDFPDNIRAHE